MKKLELSPQNFRYDVLHLLYSDVDHFIDASKAGDARAKNREIFTLFFWKIKDVKFSSEISRPVTALNKPSLPLIISL